MDVSSKIGSVLGQLFICYEMVYDSIYILLYDAVSENKTIQAFQVHRQGNQLKPGDVTNEYR